MASTGRKTLETSAREQRNRQREQMQNELRSRSSRMKSVITEFQPDAVEIEQRVVSGGARWTLYVVALFLVAVVWWSCWAEVDQIVRAPGKIVSIAPVRIIQGAAAAPIESMIARFGQIVRPGDTLATLDSTFSDADIRQFLVKIDAVNSAVARLEAEREEREFNITGHERDRGWLVQLSFYEERKKQFNSKMEEFASEVLKVESQKASNLLEMSATESLLETLRGLRDTKIELYEKGSESKINMLNSVEQVKQEETKVEVAKSKFRELDAQLVVIEKQTAAFVAGWRAEIAGKLTEAYDELGTLQEDLNKANKALEYTTISVPADGEYPEYYVLEAAERTLGSVVKEGEALFKLAPLGSTLEVEMEVPSRDIGRVQIGDEVKIKLTAFPYQKHGYLTGTITTISEGTEEKQSEGGQPQMPYYRARVSIVDPNALTNVSKNFRLIPDSVAECEIKVGRRSVISFFLYPLWRAFDTSIRDP